MVVKYKTFVIKRLLLTIPTILGVSFLVWFVLHVLYKGSPLAPYVFIDPNRLTQAQILAIEKRYGLDQPWYIRFVKNMIGLFQGDWGYNRFNQPVLPDMIRRIPYTLELITFAIVLGLLIGIPVGIKAATTKSKFVDSFLNNISIITYSFPSFVVALFFQFVLFIIFLNIASFFKDSNILALNPYYGTNNPYIFKNLPQPIFHTGFHIIDALLTFNPSFIYETINHMIFPILTVTLAILPLIIKMTRQAMLNTMTQDFILLAKAKGLPERRILYNHALKNAIFPLTTVIGLLFGSLLISTIFVEYIFQIPGTGAYLIAGVTVFDMPVIQGFVTFFTFSYIIINLVVDLSYGYVDPRVR